METVTLNPTAVVENVIRMETVELKTNFIERSKQSAIANFKLMEAHVAMLDAMNFNQQCDYWGVKYVVFTETTVHNNMRYCAGTHIVDNASGSIYLNEMRSYTVKRNAVRNGMDAYIASAVKNAEKHYESSLMKLVGRIVKKGINVDTMQLKSGYVGINLEIRLSDGMQTIYARTIWAGADSVLVTPHYRYIIN